RLTLRSTLFPYTTLFRSTSIIGVLLQLVVRGEDFLPWDGQPIMPRQELPAIQRYFTFVMERVAAARDLDAVGRYVCCLFGDKPTDRKSTRLNSSHVKISY